MNKAVEYHINRASAGEITEHLRSCDANFVPPLSERVEIAEYAKKIVSNATRFEAWAEGALVGLVAAYCNDEIGHIGYVTSVSLLGAWGGKGIGARLMTNCLERATNSGMQSISLEVDSTNLPAIKLYKKFGFTVLEENAPVVVMTLRLKSSNEKNEQTDSAMSQNETSGTVNKPILIFPGGMPRSLEYLRKCVRDGQTVIGASSLDYDVSREQYPAWIHLPYVTQPEFDVALKQAILSFDIGGIFSPNPVVWNQLNRTLGEIAPGVALVNDSPVNAELNGYRAAQAHAREIIGQPLPLASEFPAKPTISEINLAALIRHADLIPGMCDDEKLRVLCEIARRTPHGDVVEIGSWWGKSAFILARLARCYDIGNLLCVDPWTNELIVSKDANVMVDAAFAQVDAEEAFRIFQIGLLPCSFNHINYLRMTSVEGARHYGGQRSVSTDAFGSTEYTGGIAMLHIDGNHAYESAKADIESWGKFVIPGGWIVFDDYVWPYGNGPQRAGDEFLESSRSGISTAFVMGSALFIQMNSAGT